MTTPTTPVIEARERMVLLAAACETDAFAHLPVISRENAAPFAADLRTTLTTLSTLEAEVKLLREALQDMAAMNFGVSCRSKRGVNDWFNDRARLALATLQAPESTPSAEAGG